MDYCIYCGLPIKSQEDHITVDDDETTGDVGDAHEWCYRKHLEELQ